jgi:hypothetical protein
MTFSFTCAINNNDIPAGIAYEQLFEYSHFNINIETGDMSVIFDSDVMTTDEMDIRNFVNNFLNNTNASLTFNSGNGSCVMYSDNKLSFIVYTYKEGTFTTLSYSIRVNDNNREELNNVFRQLLDFKITFNSIELDEEDDYYDSDQSQELDEQPENE